jgi:hypothetical protein
LARQDSNLNQRDEEIDDAIATLNNGGRRDRRGSGDSGDSINMRDSAFDPMAKSRKRGGGNNNDLFGGGRDDSPSPMI